MKYFIPQITGLDCGYACLKMVIAIKYDNPDALYLKEDESHQDYSFKELGDMALEYGITFDGAKFDIKEDVAGVALPAIALIEKREKYYHYVVITKMKNNYVTILDPEEGEMKMKVVDFLAIWTGKILFIKEFVKKDITFYNPLKEEKKNDVLSTVLQIFSAVFLMAGIFFINSKMIYLPIIFLGLFVIFEILFRFHLIKKMQRFDWDIQRKIKVDDHKYHEFFQRYEAYKREAHSSKMNLVFTIMVIIFMTFLLLINHLVNFLLVMVPFILAVVSVKFINPYLRRKEADISFVEAGFDNAEKSDDFLDDLDDVHYQSYQIARHDLIKRYVFVSLLLITSFVALIYSKTMLLPYLIFNLAISHMLYERFTDLLLASDSRFDYL
nr:hypothetical protein [Bacilli bacterium]